MSELVIPSWIIPDEEEIELVDDNTVPFNPQFGRGQSQRQSYGAPRFKISRKHTVRLGEEANLISILTAARGAQNSIRTALKKILRGSFTTSEVIVNNQFANGTTGWSVVNNSTHTVQDQISKLQIGEANTGIGFGYGIGKSVTTIQYGAYALRSSLLKGRGIESYSLAFGNSIGAGDFGGLTESFSGLKSFAGCPTTTSPAISLGGACSSGSFYDDYTICNYTSLARCAVVDNGPNNILYSNQFDNAAWTLTGVTVSPNVLASYDLTTTADSILETAANSSHQITQGFTVTSATQDVSISVAVKPGTRTFERLSFFDGTSTATATFQLTSSGTVSSTSVAGGWTNIRAFIQSLGNGWYLLAATLRKTSSATFINGQLLAGTDATTFSYTGSAGSTAFSVSDFTMVAGSSFPSKFVRSTSTAVAASVQSGSTLFIKGLPSSSSGLCMPGDFIEFGGELKRLTAKLDSDAAGRGYLQFEPEMIRAPSDNDAVIFFEPMGRFLLSNLRIRPRVSDVEISYDLEQIYE